MALRLLGRRYARQDFNLGDYLTMGAFLCALTRLAVIHVVLIWGTNNMTDAEREDQVFTPSKLYQLEMGSKLSIANRAVYNSYLWLQKLVLLDLYRRLIHDLPYEKWLLRFYLFVFFVAFTIAQVYTFVECRPFHLYWQVLPDPGPCAQAQEQLIVVGVLNILTDFMLMLMPVPVIVKLKAPLARKLQLFTLFTLGIFIIAITMIRLPINSSHPYSQVNRTTWASVELLTSAIVVNAPTLYSFWNKRRREKSAPLERGQGDGDNAEDRIAMETIGGSNFSNSGGPKRKPTGGVLQTKEVVVSEFRLSGDYIKLADERDHSSQHSS
ncbi:hypothetical protein V8C35DRAFT_276081 [Trichoderma chlorosporum]